MKRSRLVRSKRRSKSKRRSRSKSKCKKYLSAKIGKNIDEFYGGRYASKAQAIAVSYSQIRKKHPACKKVLKSRK